MNASASFPAAVSYRSSRTARRSSSQAAVIAPLNPTMPGCTDYSFGPKNSLYPWARLQRVAPTRAKEPPLEPLGLKLPAVTFDPAIEAPAKKPTSVRRPRVAADRGSGGAGRGRSALNVLAALIVSAAVLYAAFAGAGPLPALGPAFNPVTGAWTMAADAAIGSQTLRLAGPDKPINVALQADRPSHLR